VDQRNASHLQSNAEQRDEQRYLSSPLQQIGMEDWIKHDHTKPPRTERIAHAQVNHRAAQEEAREQGTR
jgi:hypothetical protein